MHFKNPQNDHVETVTSGLLWVFLWTPIYYAVKAIWTHAIVRLALGIIGWSVTMGIGAIAIGVVYAFLNKSIVKSHYLKKGWIEV